MAVKYLKLFQTEFRNLNEYKLDFFSRFARLFVNILITVMIWSAIFAVTGKSEIAGLDKYYFISYMILTRIITMGMGAWRTVETIEQLIFYGDLSSYIIKPLNINLFIFSKLMLHYLFYSVFGIIILLASLPIIKILGLSIFTPSGIYWILFLISLFLALVMHMIFYYGIGLLTFWFGRVWSIISGVEIIERFFSGYFVPITISPALALISGILPFKYMLTTPLMIYLEKITIINAISQIGIQVIWIIILYAIICLILRKGLEKFDSQGG